MCTDGCAEAGTWTSCTTAASTLELHRNHTDLVPLAREGLQPDGKSWKVEGEFLAKRRAS